MITLGGLLKSCVGSLWLCVAVFSHTMEEADIILSELLRFGGLSLEQKQALITQARLSMSDRVQIFPDNPHLYMDRLQALLVRALFPHSGLLSIRKEAVGGSSSGEDSVHLSRADAWNALNVEFADFKPENKSPGEVRGVLIRVVELIMNSEVPLHLPPRWTAQLMDWIQLMTRFQNERVGISLQIQPDMPVEGRAYLDAVMINMDNARKRADRQWQDLWATDEAVVCTKTGTCLPPPSKDVEVNSQVPPCLRDFRPSLTLPFVPSGNPPTPKRDRGEEPDFHMQEPKRTALAMADYGLPRCREDVRY